MSQQISIPAEMTQQFIQGENPALIAIIDLCNDILVHYAIRRIGDRGKAEEIVSDTFLRLWQRKDMFNRDSNLLAWMFVVCRNLCTDHLRHIRRYDEIATVAEELNQENCPWQQSNTAAAQRMSQVVDQMMTGRLLEEVLPIIPERYRTCLTLRAKGLEYAEIAQRLDIPLGTVKSRINYGRTRARTIAAEAGWDLDTLTCETA